MSTNDQASSFASQLKSIDSKPRVSSRSCSSEDGDTSQDEGLPASEYGGVEPGSYLKERRYLIIGRLGSGHFSAVFLAYDYHEKRSVAVKVQRSAEHYIEAARDEIELLRDLRRKDPEGKQPVVHLNDCFELYYDGGEPPKTRKLHICTVFEVLGKTLLSLIRRCRYEGAPLNLVKVISKGILQGLDYLHTECKIIHTDLKPENVMFELTPKQESHMDSEVRRLATEALTNTAVFDTDHVKSIMMAFGPEETDNQFALAKVKIIDFGNACWTHKQFASDIQTRQYRCPEAIIGAGYDTSADIWSAGCMIFEILTGDYLFDPRGTESYCRDEDHLAMMMEIVGKFPSDFVSRGAYSGDYFDRYDELPSIPEIRFIGLRKLLHRKYGFSKDLSADVADFLIPMLKIRPERRAKAKECMEHPYLDLNRDVSGRRGRERQSRFPSIGGNSSPNGLRAARHMTRRKSKYQRAYRKLFKD
ncbi:hypothetical protein NDN08_001997 [Rhodosorus marinus]|uniref:non-specific serine/threonine protein kinase n=1 Tax=Rhodosorus marinus TaxID=101924 RepID=A0AAV8USG3_9RHOD|nr:hypothetical protein NDN08_001997 [Rhodosorus marinus]